MKQSFLGAALLHKWLLFLSIGSLWYSCAPTPYVKTLEHRQHSVSASLGGPMLKIPGVATMPIPFIQAGYGYGLTKTTTVHGSWNVTSSIFGVMQLNAGASQQIWKHEDKMGATLAPSFNFMVDVFEKNVRFYPQLDGNYYFNYRQNEQEKRTNYAYVGFTNWFDLSSTKAHGVPQSNHLIFNPQIGHVFEREHWNFQLEAKLLAPYKSNQNIVVDYVSPFGNKGALGVYFGVNYKF